MIINFQGYYVTTCFLIQQVWILKSQDSNLNCKPMILAGVEKSEVIGKILHSRVKIIYPFNFKQNSPKYKTFSKRKNKTVVTPKSQQDKGRPKRSKEYIYGD